MYVRVSKSGNRSYLQIVEGYRDEAGRVKQKVIANLGRLDKMGEKDLSALIHGLQRAVGRPETLCLIPWFDGAILSQEWKEALWDKFVTGAPRPRTPSELQYSDRKLRSRS